MKDPKSKRQLLVYTTLAVHNQYIGNCQGVRQASRRSRARLLTIICLQSEVNRDLIERIPIATARYFHFNEGR